MRKSEKRAKQREEIADLVRFEIDGARNATGFYTLTIEFADGSTPRMLDVPYQPWNPRNRLVLPYRIIPAESDDA